MRKAFHCRTRGSCGHEVLGVVHSGLDAIRAYRQQKQDVVLMDFAMARLNGLTA